MLQITEISLSQLCGNGIGIGNWTLSLLLSNSCSWCHVLQEKILPVALTS